MTPKYPLPTTKLSQNFTWEEACTTENRIIDNSIPPELYPAIYNTARKMESVRSSLDNVAIFVNSWYRCRALNLTIGSNPDTTQHAIGKAVDFRAPAFGSPLYICKRLERYKETLDFDQLIYEHTWVHISFRSNPNVKARRQVLTLLRTGRYSIGITDKNGVPV